MSTIKKPQGNTASDSPASSPARINFQQIQFAISCARLTQLPGDSGAEVAFAGRSNSGKSSTLNRLTNRKALARTSKTPGRTQLLNFFNLPGDSQRLVDLPGYGFAKVRSSMRANWGQLIADYLDSRQSLKGVVIVMDCRRPLTDLDIQLISWCEARDLPTLCLLNKADKFGRGAAGNIKLQVEKQLKQEFPGSRCMLFSASKGTGSDQLIQIVSDWLNESAAVSPDTAQASDKSLPE